MDQGSLGNILHNINNSISQRIKNFQEENNGEHDKFQNDIKDIYGKIGKIIGEFKGFYAKTVNANDKNIGGIKTSYYELNARIQFLEEDIEKLSKKVSEIEKQPSK